MTVIQYDRNRLATVALLCLLGVAGLLVLFFYPAAHFRSIYLLPLQGRFGHAITVPALCLGLAVTATRLGMLAAGMLDAVSVDEGGLVVTTLWRTVRIPWAELLDIRLVRTQHRRVVTWTMRFRRCQEGSVRLPLASVALGELDYPGAVADLLARRDRALARPAVRVEAAAAAAPVPVRAGFGRKVA